MRLRLDLAASVPKDLERPELNEDAWAANEQLTCLAISDGASESYDSRVWANLLVRKFIDDPAFDSVWLSDALDTYVRTVDYPALSWSKQASFDRGSFATLIGVRLHEHVDEVEVLSVGDSLAVHVRDGQLLQSFPFIAPEQFNARPRLLATLPVENAYLLAADYRPDDALRAWSIEPGDAIYVMTDAVGQWFLTRTNDGPTATDLLDAIASEEAFAVLVHKLRSERLMRLDDSTVLRLKVEGD